MTNREIWDALSRISTHIHCAAIREPRDDAAWTAISRGRLGVDLLTHDAVAVQQLSALADRLDAEGNAAELRAGIDALRHLVDAGHLQGAAWLALVASNALCQEVCMDDARC